MNDVLFFCTRVRVNVCLYARACGWRACTRVPVNACLFTRACECVLVCVFNRIFLFLFFTINIKSTHQTKEANAPPPLPPPEQRPVLFAVVPGVYVRCFYFFYFFCFLFVFFDFFLILILLSLMLLLNFLLLLKNLF